MLVEWEITLKCNYKCNYCTNLNKSLHPVLDKPTIRTFIQNLGINYPGVEIFVFGGEPFVHPYIGYIIECFNEFSIPFVIQTNFSKYSVNVMKDITSPFTINISIHPTEVSFDLLKELFSTPVKINTIDVMYTGKEAIKYYLEVKKQLPDHDHTFLTPVTDFGDGVSDKLLAEYNQLRDHPTYTKLIKFEQVKRFGKHRSELWLDPEFTTKGKPCLYTDKYFLYGPTLELYNCCYRVKTDGICKQDKCFLM